MKQKKLFTSYGNKDDAKGNNLSCHEHDNRFRNSGECYNVGNHETKSVLTSLFLNCIYPWYLYESDNHSEVLHAAPAQIWPCWEEFRNDVSNKIVETALHKEIVFYIKCVWIYFLFHWILNSVIVCKISVSFFVRAKPLVFWRNSRSFQAENDTDLFERKHDFSLRWRHNGRDSVSYHQPDDCLLNRLFRRRSEKTSKLRVTGLCAGTSPGTGEFPAQMASYAENVSIWWLHYVLF